MNLNLARTLSRSAVNGPGERFVLWVQGCPLQCEGCWNPDTWAFTPRQSWSVEALEAEIISQPDLEGVTFTGGEPFAQAQALAALATRVRARGLSVVIFTGYTRAELTSRDAQKLLAQTDLLIAGRYDQTQPLDGRGWRGSSNQQVHFLTERYGPEVLMEATALEIHLYSDGALTLTGFPGQEWREGAFFAL
ncbi:MAG: 4Fe-4S single cluster domain-containing protein [Myxococcota bacterium]